MSNPDIRPLQTGEWDQVAALIHASTNAWYRNHGGGDIFSGDPLHCRLFPEVYEALDPGCCAVWEDPTSGAIAGSCFYHPRETHVSLGILNVHPDHFGKGIAGRLLDFVIAFARDLPVRLVSSALNLDSFALYNRRGFAVTGFYQDMQIQVPEAGLRYPPPENATLRDATPADAAPMAALEHRLVGINREKDFRHFIENAAGIWGVSVWEKSDSSLGGFLASINHPGSRMLGPGVAENDAIASTLIFRELDQRHRGAAPVFLVPSNCPALVAAVQDKGARILELHVSQALGPNPYATSGISLPTFMPETG